MPFVVAASCRIADIIVAVVAKSDVAYSNLMEKIDIVEVFSDGVTIFDAKEDGFFPFVFQSVEIVWIVCDAHPCRIELFLFLHHIQPFDGEICGFLQRVRVSFALWNICGHDNTVESTFFHKRQIDFSTFFFPDIEFAWENHGRVSMRIYA